MTTTARTPRTKTRSAATDEAFSTWHATCGPDARRERALEREQANEGRSPQQRLQVLNDRLGPGVGARKERARLARKTAPSPRRAAEAQA